MEKFKDLDIVSKAIPANVLDAFFQFLEQQNKVVKRYYDVEDDVKIETRQVVEERPTDLKAALALFEKIYPEYFDQLTIERLAKLRKDSGDEDLDKLKEAAKNMLKL